MTMLMQFGLVGVFTAMDGIMFYIFWELTLIPIFLIALWFGAPERKKALIKFFIYTFVGSLAMLLSLMALGTYTKDFSHESLMAVQLSAQTAFWVMGGFFLAFAIKIPLFPFHTWQPETYTVSPMAGTMLLSALMLKMALYGMVRWMIPLAPEAMDDMQCIVITLGLIGIVYAAIIAIKQTDIKKVWAFASISHVGLIAAGIILFNKEALGASFIQIVNHSLVAVGLFLAAGILEQRLNTRDLTQMGGVAKLAPKFAFWFAVICFASVSVPFTSGFIGEFLLLKGLYSYNWIIGLVAATTLVFGAVYTLRAYQLSMYGAPKLEAFKDLSWNEMLAFFIISVIIVILGVYPQVVLDFVGPSLDRLFESMQTSNTLVP
jgi:NADH-quinone oxidoreductase subunit M